jgi:SH3-like domain-containing protein
MTSRSRLSFVRERRSLLALAMALSALVPTGAAWSAEFRSVAGAALVLFDGPSLQARKLWVAPRQMPLEVVSVVGQWVKVRDVSGDVAWVERAELSAQRTVVTRTSASVRNLGQEGAEVVFATDRGVVLELVDPTPVSGWVRVRHRDGSSGWVRSADVWGL